MDKAGEILEALSGQSVLTFAYPFAEIKDLLRKSIEKNFIEAGDGGLGELYYTFYMGPDWYNIHSQATMSH